MGIYDSPEKSLDKADNKPKIPKQLKSVPASMKSCRQCGKSVRKDAVRCPFCGCHRPAKSGFAAFLMKGENSTGMVKTKTKASDKPIPLETLQREYYEGEKGAGAAIIIGVVALVLLTLALLFVGGVFDSIWIG